MSNSYDSIQVDPGVKIYDERELLHILRDNMKSSRFQSKLKPVIFDYFEQNMTYPDPQAWGSQNRTNMSNMIYSVIQVQISIKDE